MRNRAPVYSILHFPQGVPLLRKNMYPVFLMELSFYFKKGKGRGKRENSVKDGFFKNYFLLFLKVWFQKNCSQEWIQAVEREINVLGVFRIWLERS